MSTSTVILSTLGVASVGSFVAGEVKELARQTSEATTDIGDRIAALQATTNESVRSIGEITNVMSGVGTAADTIAKTIDEQSHATEHMAVRVASSSAAEGISMGPVECAKASDQIASSIMELKQSAYSAAECGSITKQANYRAVLHGLEPRIPGHALPEQRSQPVT